MNNILRKILSITKIPHPEKCPNCKEKNTITYERFSGKNGEYVCDECGWGCDAKTGEINNRGNHE